MRRFPLRRLRVNPTFRKAVYADRRGIVRLAHELGLVSYTRLSRLVWARRIPDTDLNVERFRKLAELVGFTGEVFL